MAVIILLKAINAIMKGVILELVPEELFMVVWGYCDELLIKARFEIPNRLAFCPDSHIKQTMTERMF